MVYNKLDPSAQLDAISQTPTEEKDCTVVIFGNDNEVSSSCTLSGPGDYDSWAFASAGCTVNMVRSLRF